MKSTRTLLKLAIICTALSDSGNGATTPALASIISGFPDISPNIVQMAINSSVAIFLALTPIVYSKLVLAGVRKKRLLTISAILFIIGGIGPFFLHGNIWIVMFLRALLGIASGISIPLSVDLVMDFFEDKERRTMTGFVSATTGVSGIIFQMLGGWLANINWTYTFLAYGVSIVFVIIWAVFLPEPPRAEKVQEEVKAGKADKRLYGGCYAVAILVFLFYLMWYIVPNNGAIVLVGEGLANPAQVGGVFTMMVVATTVVAILHGTLFKAVKFALIPISFALLAVGLYICYVATNTVLYTVGILGTGLGMGMIVPAAMTKVVCMTSYTASPKAVSWCYVGLGLGGFFQPILFSLFGQYSTGRPPFIIGLIATVVFAIIAIIVNKVTASHTVIREQAKKV